MTEQQYRQWLAEFRQLAPPASLSDNIMAQVAELESPQCEGWGARVLERIDDSRSARWAVYGGALAVGSLPFIFLAYVTQFVAI